MGYESNTGLGVQAHYGARGEDEVYGGVVGTKGYIKEAVWTFAYNGLPAGVANGMAAQIPANAYIISAKLHVLTAMDGTSGTLTIGLDKATDGTAIDADGIDAAVAQAALTDGALIACDGALVGANIGSVAGVLVATTGGTVTAGNFRLVVEYMLEKPTSYTAPTGT